ncbi:MAG TPA: SGNH/GDSL hydrolase family protein [Solirubrobacteraceae bacterium]|nr:SGNH/GDSL hydrolase family protein [Solirubrobacteraceae bacterium]
MGRRAIVAAGALALLALVGAAVARSGSTSSPAKPRTPTIIAPPGSQDAAGAARRPLLAVVGASVSAGVGAGHRHDAWPEDLGRLLGWRVAVDADPGAGFVNRGNGDRGPFSRLASQLDVGRRDPNAIIIQGGHDDIGRPLPLIRHRVECLVGEIHREAPHALLVVVSVFARGNRPSPAAVATDRTIVGAARRADPGVVVVDPLAEHWRFPRIGDHLHPTTAGHRWIARRLAAVLRERLATP